MPLWVLLVVIVSLAGGIVTLFRMFDRRAAGELERAYKREDQYVLDRTKAMDHAIETAKILERLADRIDGLDRAQREAHARIEIGIDAIKNARPAIGG